MGFNDGVSNPNPDAGEEFDRFVCLKNEKEFPEFDELPEFVNGTYRVFQKIAHDLDQWRPLMLNSKNNGLEEIKSLVCYLELLNLQMILERESSKRR
jgi:deferrochelatase/peroxidase EfeB